MQMTAYRIQPEIPDADRGEVKVLNTQLNRKLIAAHT